MKVLKFFFILTVFLALSSCAGNKPEYIFLITLDTMRADAVNYVEGNRETPNLAMLASRGTRFRNFYSVIPITLPSHASMFYSLYPHDLRLYNNGQVNPSKYPALAQLMKSNGFDTSALISLGVLKTDFGLDRGFDRYLENFPSSVWKRSAGDVNRDLFPLIKKSKGKRSFFWVHYSDPHEPYFPPYFDGRFEIRQGEKKIFSINNSLYPLVREKIELIPGENRFRFKTVIPSQITDNDDYRVTGVSYSDLEVRPAESGEIDLILPEQWTGQENRKNEYFSRELESTVRIVNRSRTPIRAELSFLYKLNEENSSKKKLYLECVRYLDGQIGKLVDRLKAEGILERSVIIIVGDHGEGLGEYRDHFGHIHYLNKVYSHVPFIIYGKGIEKGKVRDDLVSNLNIAPTILEITGIKKPGFMKGVSVLKPVTDNRLVLETFSPEAYFDAFSVIEFPEQIIFYPGRSKDRIEYIDLENDPHGISADDPGISRDSRQKLLRSILGISRSITATKGKIGKRNRIHEDILRSLGYL